MIGYLILTYMQVGLSGDINEMTGQTHDAVELCHLAAKVGSLLLQGQVERILQDVLIIYSHKELEVWILQTGQEDDGRKDINYQPSTCQGLL